MDVSRSVMNKTTEFYKRASTGESCFFEYPFRHDNMPVVSALQNTAYTGNRSLILIKWEREKYGCNCHTFLYCFREAAEREGRTWLHVRLGPMAAARVKSMVSVCMQRAETLFFFCKNSFHLQENDSVYRKQRYFTGSISEFSCGRKNTKVMGIFQRKVD